MPMPQAVLGPPTPKSKLMKPAPSSRAITGLPERVRLLKYSPFQLVDGTVAMQGPPLTTLKLNREDCCPSELLTRMPQVPALLNAICIVKEVAVMVRICEPLSVISGVEPEAPGKKTPTVNPD